MLGAKAFMIGTKTSVYDCNFFYLRSFAGRFFMTAKQLGFIDNVIDSLCIFGVLNMKWCVNFIAHLTMAVNTVDRFIM